MIDRSLSRRRALREMSRALASGDIQAYTRAALSYAIEGEGDIFERLEELGIADDDLVPDDPACKAALRLLREMRGKGLGRANARPGNRRPASPFPTGRDG